MELSKTIKKLRNEKGWSQETLAERAYVSRQTISNWENEKSLPDVHSLLILSDIFSVSLDELIKGDVETMKETIRNEDQKSLKKMNWVGVIGFMLLIFGVTPLFEYGGELGRVLAGLLAGALSVCIFMSFHKSERIKQENDIRTKREWLAFMEGSTLDDIENQREQEKRTSQKRLLIAVTVQAAAILIIGVICVINSL